MLPCNTTTRGRPGGKKVGIYAADFNDPGLDPTLAMESSFFETFAMTGLQKMGLEMRNVLSLQWLLHCTMADCRTLICMGAAAAVALTKSVGQGNYAIE